MQKNNEMRSMINKINQINENVDTVNEIGGPAYVDNDGNFTQGDIPNELFKTRTLKKISIDLNNIINDDVLGLSEETIESAKNLQQLINTELGVDNNDLMSHPLYLPN